MFNERSKADMIAEKYDQIMDLLGIPKTPDNEDTPKRVARALLEMTENARRDITDLEAEMTTFPTKFNGEVTVKDIIFSSLCEHHHLPFFGVASISMMPGDQTLGLSKYARIVEFFAKKPNTQEAMTQEIADFIGRYMDPFYVTVELTDVQHTCMGCRGVRASTATTSTNYTWTRMPEDDDNE